MCQAVSKAAIDIDIFRSYFNMTIDKSGCSETYYHKAKKG